MKKSALVLALLLSACAGKQHQSTTSVEPPVQIEPNVQCTKSFMDDLTDNNVQSNICRVVWGTSHERHYSQPFCEIELLGVRGGQPLFLGSNPVDPISGYLTSGGVFVGWGESYMSGPWIMISRESDLIPGTNALVPDSNPDNFLWIVEGRPLFVGVSELGDQVVWGDESGSVFSHIHQVVGVVEGKPLYIGINLQGEERGYRAVWGKTIDNPHEFVTRLSVVGGKMAYSAMDEPDFGRQRIVWGSQTGPVWDGITHVDGLTTDGRLMYRVRLPSTEEDYDEKDASTWKTSNWVVTVLGEEHTSAFKNPR